MTNSTPNQDCCICLYASPGPQKRTKQNQVQLIVEIYISTAAVQKNPIRNRSPRIHQTTQKTFQYPRLAFLSATPNEQSDIIHKMIQGLEIPFPLENINWGLNFPTDETPSRPENLNEIVSNRLSGIACCCGYMSIHIRKLEKLDPDKYQELCPPKVRKQPLDDWILENQGNVKLERSQWLGFIYELGLGSPVDNKYYGLRSEKMESAVSCCSVCMKDFEKNSQAIRMPCSHIFHGFCILKWLQITPSCPLCRSQLFFSNPTQDTT